MCEKALELVVVVSKTVNPVRVATALAPYKTCNTLSNRRFERMSRLVRLWCFVWIHEEYLVKLDVTKVGEVERLGEMEGW